MDNAGPCRVFDEHLAARTRSSVLFPIHVPKFIEKWLIILIYFIYIFLEIAALFDAYYMLGFVVFFVEI